jgi:hypothetical protein
MRGKYSKSWRIWRKRLSVERKTVSTIPEAPNGVRRCPLAFVYFPVSFGLKVKFEQAVLGVMTLAAAGTDQIAAPTVPFPIVIGRNREAYPTAARNHINAKI